MLHLLLDLIIAKQNSYVIIYFDILCIEGHLVSFLFIILHIMKTQLLHITFIIQHIISHI